MIEWTDQFSPFAVSGVLLRGQRVGNPGGVSFWPAGAFSPREVALTRRVLARQLSRHPDDFRLMRQVHGSTVIYRGATDAGTGCVRVDRSRTDVSSPDRTREDASAPSVPTADAQWTDRPGLVLVANIADCCPVIVADPSAGVAGIAHSGWRGTAGEVAPALIHTLRTNGATDFRVWIGPCAEGEAYEVDSDVYSRFDRWPAARRPHPTRPRKYLLDVREVVRQQLLDAGVPADRITVSTGGTIRDRRYHSHRRDSFGAGRMAAFVSIDSV